MTYNRTEFNRRTRFFGLPTYTIITSELAEYANPYSIANPPSSANGVATRLGAHNFVGPSDLVPATRSSNHSPRKALHSPHRRSQSH